MTPLPAADVDHAVARVVGGWDDLRGARLLVTGGTGFFGTWMLRSFVAANQRLGLGAEAVVLSRDPARFAARSPRLAASPSLRLLAGDVRSFELPAGEISHVLHLATEASPRLNLERPDEMLGTIVDGTRHVLALARGRGARRLLFASSGAVYGRQPPELARIPEEFPGAPDPASPGSAYAVGKRRAEELVVEAAASGGLATTVARGFAFVGPLLPLDAHFAVGNFLRDGLAAEASPGRTGRVLVRGDGTPLRSYLHAADLAAWLWTILLRGEPGRAWNVGSDDAVSILELAREVAELFAERGVRLDVDVARPSVPGVPAERYVPSIDRARRELGLDVFRLRREALRRTIEAIASGGRP